jgi:hypothetical protein
MTAVDLKQLAAAEQDARWRRSLVVQWCELEGFNAAFVVSCEDGTNGSVVVTHYVANAMGRCVEQDGKPIVTTTRVKPSTPPPWREWLG